MHVRLRHLLQPSNLFLLALVAGCLTDSADYSPEDDARAIESIASTWSAGNDVSLALCEDRTAPVDDDTCQVEHVVRGDGRSPAHSESHGGAGCGGCPFANVAYVRGTISGGAFAEPATVTGTVFLGVTGGADRYEYPYNVELSCAAPAACWLSGSLAEDGTLSINTASGITATDAPFTFARAGAAACP